MGVMRSSEMGFPGAEEPPSVTGTTGSPTTGQFTDGSSVLWDYWEFAASGTLTTDGPVAAKMLMVGGGGGGGGSTAGYTGGGGGGGAVVTMPIVLPDGTITITIGAGGAGGGSTGSSGGSTTVSGFGDSVTYIAGGGGGGAAHNGNGLPGVSGGQGGGGGGAGANGVNSGPGTYRSVADYGPSTRTPGAGGNADSGAATSSEYGTGGAGKYSGDYIGIAGRAGCVVICVRAAV
jgi:hypothetical protein